MAAAIPTRNEPSCSLNTIDWTLGRSTTASMMANFTAGNSLATFSMPLAWAKPIAHDDLGAAPRHVAQRLLALGLAGDLELAIRDARSPS